MQGIVKQIKYILHKNLNLIQMSHSKQDVSQLFNQTFKAQGNGCKFENLVVGDESLRYPQFGIGNHEANQDNSLNNGIKLWPIYNFDQMRIWSTITNT